jgi:hypothetical protein
MPDNADIKLAIELIAGRKTALKEFYDYYDGRHQINFASEKFKNKFGKRLQRLRENLCRTVVKAPTSRLEIIGFASQTEAIDKKAWEIWKRNNMPLNSSKVHREALKTGDAFCIVWPDPSGRPRIHVQTSANVCVWRSTETGQIEKAAKLWLGSDKRHYLTIYYPDRIEKYITKPAGKADQTASVADPKSFEPRQVEGEKWPLQNPYGRVPVFQFTFDEETDDCSNSILKDVIPLNDALNKSLSDIFVAQEFNAIRQRWATGIQFEKDPETGKTINPFDYDSQLWDGGEGPSRAGGGAEPKFGEFTDAELEQMLKVKQECVRDIALVSGVPPSYFNLETSDFPSGEALRKIEARFTAIVQDSQRSFGETWGNAIGFALEIAGSKVSDDQQIETQWTDAAPVSETEQLDNALKKKNLGWSLEQIQRDFGLTDKQIKEMAAANDEMEKKRVENQAKFFDGGASLE